VGGDGVGASAECGDALEDLGGVFAVEEVDGEEAVVGGEREGRHFAGAQEVRDVFHLDEGHAGLFVFDAGGGGHVDESISLVSLCDSEGGW
jgi:hypothetical protein